MNTSSSAVPVDNSDMRDSFWLRLERSKFSMTAFRGVEAIPTGKMYALIRQFP
jgi:hypothetical protein